MVTEAQKRAKKKWNDAHRTEGNIYTYRSKAKKFIKEYAGYKDLNTLKQLIKEREEIMEKTAQELVEKINKITNFYYTEGVEVNITALTHQEMIDAIEDSILSLETNDNEGSLEIVLDPSEVEDYKELLEDIKNSNNSYFFIIHQIGLADVICESFNELENEVNSLDSAAKKCYQPALEEIKEIIK